MPEKPIIVFDLDGTLIDSRADLTDAVNEVRQLRGLQPLTLQQVISYVGDGQRNLMKRAIPGLDDDDLTTACHQMSACYAKRLTAKTILYPGIAETLPRLAERFNLCVVSNKNDDAVKAILQNLKVFQHFAATVGGGRCKKLKPDAEPLLLAASLCGTTLEGGWVVGDHRTDMAAAKNAGMKACFCAYGFGIQDTQRADAVIQHFNQLLEILHF